MQICLVRVGGEAFNYDMRLLPRLLILAALLYLGFILFGEGRRIEAQPGADHSKLFLIFGGAIICAVVAGIIVAVTFLPIFGDKIGEMIYGSSEDIAHDPFVLARESIAAGEYLQAISYYRQALAAVPDDTAALEGIADVQTKYLEQTDEAVALLENALESHWPADEETFLRCKLAEIYGRYQGDMGKARTLLLETIAAYPGTIHARNAERLLHTLEST